MKTIRRKAAILLAGLLCAASFFGCTSSSTPPAESGSSGTGTSSESSAASSQESDTQETPGDVPTITVMAGVQAHTPLDETNASIKYINENANVNIQIIALPSEAADTAAKLNLALAGGDYGDVIATTLGRDQIMQIGMRDKIAIPLNDYVDGSTNLKELFDTRPQYKALSYMSDGNLYAFPNISETYHASAYPKFWVNKDWMDTLGIAEPQTTDELYDMLVAFRDQDPNGNGEQDEIPAMGNIEWSCPIEYYLMNSFVPFDLDGQVPSPGSMSYLKDGQVTFAANTDEYREGLRYIKKLVDEKLIDVVSFSQKTDQMQQIIRQEPARVGGYTSDHFAMGINLDDYDANKSIVALPPVEGPGGARYQPHTDFLDMSGQFSWVITDKCADPEAAFALGDFMYGAEPSLARSMGKEGEDWGKLDTPKPSVLGLEAIYWTKNNYDADGAQNKNNLWIPPMKNTFENRELSNPIPDDLYLPESYEARLIQETEKVVEYFYPEYLPKRIENFIDDQDEVVNFMEMRLNLQNFVKSNTTQFLTGEKNIETDWDSYVAQLETYQLSEYLETYQKYYDIYKSRM